MEALFGWYLGGIWVIFGWCLGGFWVVFGWCLVLGGVWFWELRFVTWVFGALVLVIGLELQLLYAIGLRKSRVYKVYE